MRPNNGPISGAIFWTLFWDRPRGTNCALHFVVAVFWARKRPLFWGRRRAPKHDQKTEKNHSFKHYLFQRQRVRRAHDARVPADTRFEVVSLSREGHNQPHTLKDTRPVPQVWGTPLFLEKPAHETGTISGDDNVFIKNQSSPRIVPVVFSFQVKHQRKSDRPETGLMHFWRFSGIMKSRCGLGLEHIRQA